MGMYTELIFGANLKKNTPEKIINTLKYMIGDLENDPKDLDFKSERSNILLTCSSEYFGVNESVSRMWYSEITECWHISTRSNVKNYNDDIEKFLKWIEPYIESGSGWNDMYAIVIYEESDNVTIYYLNEEE